MSVFRTSAILMVAWLAAVLSLGGSAAGQSILNVPSPSFPTIQSGIVAAATGDTVQVAPGTYFENIDFLGKDIRVIGAGQGQSIIDGGGVAPVVTFANCEPPSALLDGFTLQNGLGHVVVTPTGSDTLGGGIYLDCFQTGANGATLRTQPTIRNCEITGNTATFGGGVCYYRTASGVLEDCNIHGNTPTGVFSFDATFLVVRRCSFVNHSPEAVSLLIGGVPNPSTWPLLEDCYFGFNQGSSIAQGAAVGIGSGVSVRIRGCVFESNMSGSGGAITGNGPGGMLVIENSLFLNNTAVTNGGAVHFPSAFGKLIIDHCTFVGNTAGGAGDAVWMYEGFSPPLFGQRVIRNCIFRGTPGPGGVVTVGVPPGSPPTMNYITLDHNDIQGGWTGLGVGNFDLDPLFEDPANGDYHIRPDSPCVNAGIVPSSGALGVDFEGDPRPLFGGVDVGFDEVSDFALSLAAAGTVGLVATGQAVDVLAVNGSAGGPLRRVDLTLGQPFLVTLGGIPGSPPGAPFVLYGMLGVAGAATVTSLPAPLPTLVLPACDAFPNFQPFVFTLASSVTGLGCAPLIGAPPAPWASPFWSVPFPVTFTLQGLEADPSSGTVFATNALRVRIQ